jgi:hypothetical protein
MYHFRFYHIWGFYGSKHTNCGLMGYADGDDMFLHNLGNYLHYTESQSGRKTTIHLVVLQQQLTWINMTDFIHAQYKNNSSQYFYQATHLQQPWRQPSSYSPLWEPQVLPVHSKNQSTSELTYNGCLFNNAVLGAEVTQHQTIWNNDNELSTVCTMKETYSYISRYISTVTWRGWIKPWKTYKNSHSSRWTQTSSCT